MVASEKSITIALAGNPNSGKTTIFNSLTGSRQHVGNYPGVTVEKKEGICKHNGLKINVIDLPGTYSLTAYSIEEVVARNFIIDEKPDVVVDVLDASNLERNLYLAIELTELGAPLVLALNMSDVAEQRGIKFDLKKLSELLGVPIVPTVGNKGAGIKDLLDSVVAVATRGPKLQTAKVNYGREIETEIEKIQSVIENNGEIREEYDTRWLSIKLLENDNDIKEKIGSQNELLSTVEKSSAHIEKMLGDYPEIAMAERRYGLISGACMEAVCSTIGERLTFSDKVDIVVTNRVLGLPIFLGLMYLVFQLTFTLGDPPMGWIESFFEWTGDVVTAWWPKGSESALLSLLADGIIAGVGGVIVFLPNIFLLFLAIAILEDSGYMARVAFIMDRLMHKIGLHGKSFIPMLIGFGCSIPAIMATRTLENRRDRLTTMMVTPLMSCGARLPIYALIIPAFFPQTIHAPMLWTIYMIGIALAILGAKLLRSTVFKGESAPFVMELPPYRVPTIKGMLIHTWERAGLYLRKAGTIILGISIVLWVLTSYPKKGKFDRDYEAETARIETEYLHKISGLNADIGLAVDSRLLTQAMQVELDMAARQETFHEHEPGFAKAEQAKDAAFEMISKGEGGQTLIAFLETRDSVEEIRAAFDEAVEDSGIEEDSPEYVVLVRERNRTLTEIEKDAPEVHASAIKYLDEIKVPFDEKLAELEQAQQSEELAYSVAGRIGGALEPPLRLLGFDWKIGTALIGAFAAKEVFVAQMGIVYSVGEADEKSDALRSQLRENYSPLVAFCIMLFCLVSAPCMATIAVTKRESNSWKWALFQLVGLTVAAYVLTLLVYQVGSVLGIGIS